MALPQHKTCLSILRSILGPGAGNEARFAEKIGRSTSWLKKASCGQIPLTEDAAVRIGYETGINVRWLIAGDATKPPVDKDRKPYTSETYVSHRVEMRDGFDEKGAAICDEDIAIIFHKLLQIYASARSGKRSGLFVFQLQDALPELLMEYGSANIKEDSNALGIAKNLLNMVAAFEDFQVFNLGSDRASMEAAGLHHTGAEGEKYLKNFLEDYWENTDSNSPTKPKPQKKQPSRKSKRPA